MPASRRAALLLALVGLLAFSALSCSGNNAGKDDGHGAAVASDARQINERILDATSPFEDLAEFAAAGDEAGMDRALAAIGGLLPATVPVLGPTYGPLLEDRITGIRAARAANDDASVALGSVEAFGILVDALDPAALTVPKGVSRLDYIGFKIDLLGASPDRDWAEIRRTAKEAPGVWSGIGARVRNAGLRDAVETDLAGLSEAVEQEDARMLRFAARVMLDLVDLLEQDFEQPASPGA